MVFSDPEKNEKQRTLSQSKHCFIHFFSKNNWLVSRQCFRVSWSVLLREPAQVRGSVPRSDELWTQSFLHYHNNNYKKRNKSVADFKISLVLFAGKHKSQKSIIAVMLCNSDWYKWNRLHNAVTVSVLLPLGKLISADSYTHHSLWTKTPIYLSLLSNDHWSQSFVTAFSLDRPLD